jgi:chitin disaccharide deacetylase
LSSREGSKPLVFSSFADCLQRCLREETVKTDVRREIAAQYGLFKAKTGTDPDYVDGHLHIHQSPVVREALIEFISGLSGPRRPYIRNTHLASRKLRENHLPWMKAWVIGRFGSRMASRLRATGLRTNEGFAGIYDFTKTREFPNYLARFINCLDKPNGLLVVHPGQKEEWRRREFETLRDAAGMSEPNRFR